MVPVWARQGEDQSFPTDDFRTMVTRLTPRRIDVLPAELEFRGAESPIHSSELTAIMARSVPSGRTTSASCARCDDVFSVIRVEHQIPIGVLDKRVIYVASQSLPRRYRIAGVMYLHHMATGHFRVRNDS
jgi:hypothetical protein